MTTIDMRKYHGGAELTTHDHWCTLHRRQANDDCKEFHRFALSPHWTLAAFVKATEQPAVSSYQRWRSSAG